MRRMLAVLAMAASVLAGDTSSVTKIGGQFLTRPMGFQQFKYEHYTKFNKVVDDLDTLFAHGSGSADTLYKGKIDTDTLTADSAYVAFLTADTIETDSLYVTGDAVIGQYLYTSNHVGVNTTDLNQILNVDGNIEIQGGSAGVNRWIVTEESDTGTGRFTIQSGSGSAAFGGAVNLYGHLHATKPGWVIAGISNGSGGSFAVNAQALAGGTDVFTCDANGNVHIEDSLYVKDDLVIGDDVSVTDSLFVDGTCVVDSLRVNPAGGVSTETISDADRYIWIDIGGTRYKLMLKAE